MRLVTKTGFDGLVCAMLLREAGAVDDFLMLPTKVLYRGAVRLGPDDILANTHYIPGCGVWFDHHMDESVRRGARVTPPVSASPDGAHVPGVRRSSPSCARIIYDHYGGAKAFPAHYRELLDVIDRFDAGTMSILEIKSPWGYGLLGFICDPVTGLEIGRRFETSYTEMTRRLVHEWRNLPVQEILEKPAVAERIRVYAAQTMLFRDMVRQNTAVRGHVTVTDCRRAATLYAGNRFEVYSMYPEQTAAIWVRGDVPAADEDAQGRTVGIVIGLNTLNRTSSLHCGRLVEPYGGEGHRQVGTCHVPEAQADEVIDALVQRFAAERNPLLPD